MKNWNFKLMATALLIFIVCGAFKCGKKKDDPTPSNQTPTSAASNWKVGTNSYSSSTAARASFNGNNSISISDGTSNSGVAIYFATFPTAGGTYDIVKYNTSGHESTNLTNSQICVDATINSGADDYLSSGSGNVTASVVVNSGKITVTLPELWSKHFNQNGEQADSLQISGTIIEK